MGSSYYGEPNYTGNEKSGAGAGGGSSSSSRKGNNKKGGSNNSEKAPKQPQRGLGVAQLEKIRLNCQLGGTPPSNYPFPTHPSNYPSHLLNQEEIRMPTAYSTTSSSYPYASSYSFPGYQNAAVGFSQLEGANARYYNSEPQPSNTTSRFYGQYANSGTQETSYFPQAGMPRNFPVEDSYQRKRKKDRSDSIGSSSQNPNTDDSELDLELRLSR